MAQRASPPLTTLFSRLAWSLQNGGVAVSLRAFSAMAIRGRVQTLGWQHGQRGAVAARGAEFKRSMPGGAAEEGGGGLPLPLRGRLSTVNCHMAI